MATQKLFRSRYMPENYQFPREAEVSITYKKGPCQKTWPVVLWHRQSRAPFSQKHPEFPTGCFAGLSQHFVSSRAFHLSLNPTTTHFLELPEKTELSDQDHWLLGLWQSSNSCPTSRLGGWRWWPLIGLIGSFLFFLALLEIELGASHMRGKCPTTELCCQQHF